MALMKSKEVPRDAVALNEAEAIDYVWKLVTDWDKSSDTWALRYSAAILGGLSALSGVTINKYYRRKLKLGTYGYMASLLPLSLLPGSFTALYHSKAVTTDMLLMKTETCPVCYEMRSLAIQLGMGLVYPMVLGPWCAFMFANRYNTYRLPSISHQPKQVWGIFMNITRPFTSTLVYLGVAHAIVSSAVTYFEMRNHLTLRRKLLEMEKQLEEENQL